MSNERSHRTAVAIFAVVLAVAIVVAFVATTHDVDMRVANSETPPGTVGLAQPHPPLDSSPGTAIHY
jgi:hypothetical protein